MKIIVGIDPGKKGGITLMSLKGDIVKFIKMGEAYDLANLLSSTGQILRAYVEKSQAMPGQGSVSMFTYGTGYGKILGVLEALQISYELVPPQKWQKRIIGSFKKGESKKAALVKCKQLFPKETFVLPGCRVAHDGIVDSILIAEFGRQQHRDALL